MPESRLRVELIQQEQSLWCWAGAADMVLDFYGRSQVRQCQLADFQFGINDCGAEPDTLGREERSNKGVDPEEIKPVYTAFGIDSVFRQRSVTFDLLQKEINKGRPVEVCWLWDSTGGHVVIVVGWSEDASGEYLFINDPDSDEPADLISYSDLLTANGDGTWEFTWTGLKRKEERRRGSRRKR